MELISSIIIMVSYILFGIGFVAKTKREYSDVVEDSTVSEIVVMTIIFIAWPLFLGSRISLHT